MAAPSTAGLTFMVAVAALVAMQLTGGADGGRLNPHIMGGNVAKKGQFAWQAQVLSYSPDESVFLCGGSIIDAHWVLTASHCLRGGDIILKFGGLKSNFWEEDEAGTVLVLSKKFIVHEQFQQFQKPGDNGLLAVNDIGLIKLDKPLNFTVLIRPIKLPRRSMASESFNGQSMIISGWGNTEFSSPYNADLENSKTLMYVGVEIDSFSNCQENHFLCSKGHPKKTPLEGDSGGPLVWKDGDGKFVQLGVASQLGGDYNDPGAPKGTMLFSGAYTFVPYYLDWIAEKTGIAIEEDEYDDQTRT